MKFITAQQADAAMSWTRMVEALRAGHRLDKPTLRDQYTEPQGESSFLYTRSAYIPGLGYGSKVVSVYFDNPKQSPPLPAVQGGVLLFDEQTGAPVGLVDGACETKWKTVGDSLLGASLLANPKPKTLTTVGAGAICAAAIDGYREIFPSIERVIVWNRTPSRGEALATTKDALFEGDLAKACGEADIICAATVPTDGPIIDGGWLKDGCHLDLIGAHKPPHREAMDSAIARAELFVDSYETAIDDVGELRIPIENGLIERSDIRADLYELVAGTVGRSSDKAITLFKNGGGGHLDLMTARALFDAASGAEG